MRTCSPEEQVAIARHYCLTDLYWLLWFGCGRKDLEKQWLFDRCREVQAYPDGYLDLWAREHYKSTIITFGLTIKDILNDPEVTVGIFSHTRPIAKQFLRQIKREFEANELLKGLFPEVLWTDPAKQAPKWSEDEGIVVRRKGNPKESTVEAWGLVDGQPTSKHFARLVYDDVVTRESVTTPDMISKTTEAWELSRNLGAVGGKDRHAGTRYHFNDTYREILRRGFKARVHAATDTADMDGNPVLMTADQLSKKRLEMGPYTFSCQMLQNPVADKAQGFRREWIKYHNGSDGAGMNKYILVDPAGEKRKGNDYTALWVIGLGSDSNYYGLEVVRDRLNLSERAALLMKMHRKWKPMEVRYERYGMMADIEHIRSEQERQNYRFDVIEVAGQTPKNDRIRRLIPMFEQGRFYLPQSQFITDGEGRTLDMVTCFIEEEFVAFPVPLHDDMLDSLARIAEPDLPLVWPDAFEEEKPDRYKKSYNYGSAWAA